MLKELSFAINFDKLPKPLKDAADALYKISAKVDEHKLKIGMLMNELEELQRKEEEAAKTYRKEYAAWTVPFEKASK